MEIGAVKPISIEEEMRGSYLDYAMSVIVSRALPDVRDGLKPVQRRILYAMQELGLRPTAAYKKSARIVGEVLGKYHPHGDAAVYEAMVRLAQDFSMRYVLVDGQGNFGSLDNDPPAAMRYTEVRLAPIAEEMLVDVDKGTVDFTPNFDGSLEEPTILPARLPNLLVNGAVGIAVGMATSIPPHNLGEVCDGIIYLIDNPEATADELTGIIPGPDFPTAGIILGREGIKNAYATGRGRILIRAKALLEEATRTGRQQIVVTELPYQTNKAALIERIADLVKEKRIEGIAEIRDESDRHGLRIVIELKREAQPEKVLNNLYRHTALQSAFFVNMLALVEGEPRVINLVEVLGCYIDFRRQVITRRSQFELNKAQKRAHILEGLKTALDSLDQVIETIKKSRTAEAARANLMQDFRLTEAQAQAILDLQLRRLAALERQKIEEEYAETLKSIAYLEDLLANPRKILFLIKEETAQLKARFADPRRTLITAQEVTEFREEDLIQHQRVAVTLSKRGYIKRLPADTYRAQRRGGRGVKGMVTREADAVHLLVIADTHDDLLFFTNRGWVFRLKCHELPSDSSRTAKGTPLINLLPLDAKDRGTAMVVVPSFVPGSYLLLATRSGEIKKTPLQEFAQVRSNGLIAMGLEPGDELVGAGLAGEGDEVILVSERGKAIRFSVGGLRAASRTSGGVLGIRLASDDRVMSLDVVSPDAYLLVVSANGFGKLTPIQDYPLQKRGGMGVITFKVIDKTGEVAAAQLVQPSQELMIISAEGIVLRTLMEEISVQGRNSQGVGLIRVGPGDRVVSIARLEGQGQDEPGGKLRGRGPSAGGES